MNAEQNGELGRRATLHAALADRTRLRIVDTLTVGDASPSELATMLTMPSNLLAHHLNVLQAAGLIERQRSEGDHRRSYLRLVRGALDGLGPGRLDRVRRVLFVCTANSARSQLAVALWRRASAVPVASAGTHPAVRIDPGALSAAQRHRLPLRRLRPRGLEDVHLDGDLVITVCDLAHEELGHEHSARTESGARSRLHWSVPDPVRVGSDAAFDRTLDELTRRVSDLAPRLTATAVAS